MAINGTPVQSLQLSDGGTTEVLTFNSGAGWNTPTSGNLLVAFWGGRVNTTTVNSPTWPSGFTVTNSLYSGNGTPRAAQMWKESDGTESTLTFTAHTSNIFAGHTLHLMEFASTDLNVTSGAETSVEDESDVGNTVTTTSLPTFTNVTADALCVAHMISITRNSWDLGWAVDNSYVDQTDDHGSNARVMVWSATKVVSSVADNSCTFTTTDTGAGVYNGGMIFGGAISGIAVPTGPLYGNDGSQI